MLWRLKTVRGENIRVLPFLFGEVITLARAYWTKEMDEATRNLISSGEEVTIQMLMDIAPGFILTTLARRINEMALDMGYNIKYLNSKDPNTVLKIEKFSLEGDVTTDREWTKEDSEELLEFISTCEITTLRELIGKFNVPSTTISKHLRIVAKANDIQIRGLGTRVPKGGNRLDCQIHLRSGSDDKMTKGLVAQEARKKRGVERYRVLIQVDDSVQKVVMRAKDPDDAMKKAESMFKGSKALRVI